MISPSTSPSVVNHPNSPVINEITYIQIEQTIKNDIIINKNDEELILDNDEKITVENHDKVDNIEIQEIDNVVIAKSPHNKSESKIDWRSVGKLCYKSQNKNNNKVENNYLRGCQWSPDGTCLLTNSNDNILRIFELPREGYAKELYNTNQSVTELKAVLSMKEMDLIYDYCWYPFMNSNSPDTCLFASTSRKGAVRLWDAYHGIERAHIQPYDHLVEPISAQSIAFSRDGLKLYCGFDRCVRVFDIARLNNGSERRPSLGNKSDLRGIISCIATSTVNIGMYGCGSYSKDAAIFHEQTGEQILEFLRTDERIGGVTHIEFSPVDINCVVTGGRIDSALHIWDLRRLGSPLYSTAIRDVQTNQRIYFQFDPSGRYILTGNHNGNVSVVDVYGEMTDGYLLPTVAEWSAHGDVCNGLSVHPSLPLLATASGQRRLTPPWRRSGMVASCKEESSDSEEWSSDDDGGDIVRGGREENDLHIWSLSTDCL